MNRLGQEFQSGTCPHVAGKNRSLDTCLSCMSHLYISVLQGEYNEICPMIQKIIVEKIILHGLTMKLELPLNEGNIRRGNGEGLWHMIHDKSM